MVWVVFRLVFFCVDVFPFGFRTVFFLVCDGDGYDVLEWKEFFFGKFNCVTYLFLLLML